MVKIKMTIKDQKIPIREQTLLDLGTMLNSIRNWLNEDAKYTKKDSSIRNCLAVIDVMREKFNSEIKEFKEAELEANKIEP